MGNIFAVQGRYLISRTNPLTIINNGIVIFEKNKILGVGKRKELIKSFSIDQIFGDLKQDIIIPGLINAHMHSVQSLFRGEADDFPLLEWLQKVILPGESSLTEDDITTAAILAYSDALLSGTTTIADFLTVKHSDAAFEVASDIGIRGVIGKTLMDEKHGLEPSGLVEDTKEAMNDVDRLIRKYHKSKNDRIRFALTPRFLLSCSDELHYACVDKLEKYEGLILQTHAAENTAECQTARKITGKDFIPKLHDLGILREETVLAHAIWISENDRKLLEHTNTKICHCPTSNCKLGSGICNVPAYFARNIPVGLGTDGIASNHYDMFREMTLASFLAKVSTLNPTQLPAPAVLDMATNQGSILLNQAEKIGSLEPGKEADIVLYKPKQPGYLPVSLRHPVSFLVYSANSADVHDVFVAGKHIVKEKSLTTVKNNIIEKHVQNFLEKKYNE